MRLKSQSCEQNLNLKVKIEFYCKECEQSSGLDYLVIDSSGFQVECPACKTIFDFRAEVVEQEDTQPEKIDCETM